MENRVRVEGKQAKKSFVIVGNNFYISPTNEVKDMIMRELAKLFKALSDPNRLRIIKMLETRPLCLCEIQAVLSLAPSTVSKHLSILREAGFIYDEKESKWVNFYLNRGAANDVVKILLPLLSTWMPKNEQIARDLEMVQTVDRNQLCKV